MTYVLICLGLLAVAAAALVLPMAYSYFGLDARIKAWTTRLP